MLRGGRRFNPVWCLVPSRAPPGLSPERPPRQRAELRVQQLSTSPSPTPPALSVASSSPVHPTLQLSEARPTQVDAADCRQHDYKCDQEDWVVATIVCQVGAWGLLCKRCLETPVCVARCAHARMAEPRLCSTTALLLPPTPHTLPLCLQIVLLASYSTAFAFYVWRAYQDHAALPYARYRLSNLYIRMVSRHGSVAFFCSILSVVVLTAVKYNSW